MLTHPFFRLYMALPILRLPPLKYIPSYWRYYYRGLQLRVLNQGTVWARIEQVLTLRCTMLGSTTRCGLARVGVSRSLRIRLLLDLNPRTCSLLELELALSAAWTGTCPVRRLLGPSSSFRGPAVQFPLGVVRPLYYSFCFDVALRCT